MAKKSKSKVNKNLIIGICASVAVIVAIIITVVLVNNNSLNDNYFVSDDAKYVLTVENDESDIEDETTPLKTHFVYTYEGDKITGLKSYFVYADADKAKVAFDKLKEAYTNEDGEEEESIELNGKYIILTANEEVYKDLTASDIKQQIEFMESFKNIDDSEIEDNEEVEDVDDSDDTEEVTEDEE